MSTTRSPVKSSPRSPAGMVLSRVAKPSRLQEKVLMTFELTSLFRKRARKCSLNGNQSFLRMQESCLCDAFKLDPNSVPVKREFVFHHLMSAVMGFDYVPCDAPDAPKSVKFEGVTKDAKEAALEIINREPDDGRARMLAATAYFFIPELDLFEKEAELAIKDAPCDPQVLAILGALLGNHGNWPRGVRLVERANELNPRAAEGWYELTMYLNYYLQDHDYERALAMIRESPDFQKGRILRILRLSCNLRQTGRSRHQMHRSKPRRSLAQNTRE